MESIEGNEVLGILKALLDGIDERVPHIHGYALQLAEIALILGFKPCFQRICPSIIQDIDYGVRILVEDHRYILMVFLEGCFINPYALGRCLISPDEPALDGAGHDAVDFVPAEPEVLGYRRTRAIAKPLIQTRP